MSLYDIDEYKEDLENCFKYFPDNIDKNSKFLITGATGLVGSFIVDVLCYYNECNNSNFEIYCLARNMKKIENRFGKQTKNLKCIIQDITYSLDIDIEFDYIINAASCSDPKSYSLYPVETITTNIIGCNNILKHCIGKKTKVIFTSSTEVYGDNDNREMNEEVLGVIDFNKIRSGYPESKRTSEILCRSYKEEYDVTSSIVRLGYVYGPSMTNTDSKVIAQFIRNVLNNEDIILKSSGLQERSYCYISDCVSAIFNVLFNMKNCDTYNIASDSSIISIKDLASLCAKQCDKNVLFQIPDEVEKKGYTISKNCILSTDKLKNIGWSSEYSIEKGIQNTIKILKKLERSE